MFTGIIEELGEVVAIEPAADSSRITVRGSVTTTDSAHGASIAVNGACLTVTDHETKGGVVTFDVMAESLRRTVIGDLAVGDAVNLERAMVLGARLDGHLVQGHVDGTATIIERRPGDRWEEVRLAIDPELAPFVVEKGSICLDGVSLTLTVAADDHVEVALIPTTLELTTLGRKGIGDRVNVEVDILGKYVQRMLALDPKETR
ncbi:riboflavin synthase subunit alpha [Janibacter sp. Soil728]|uniref:riboflavin synthase n=1 Tax=Janibacter sp. Soil728 TaxID=1736393 RepID=UPI0006FCF606|nr:riboflavin synthase [Janibacter sp. Soil728]KRE37579.1 riboflavin synthase subunit alpha [Janibacter sp. Soil728]